VEQALERQLQFGGQILFQQIFSQRKGKDLEKSSLQEEMNSSANLQGKRGLIFVFSVKLPFTKKLKKLEHSHFLYWHDIIHPQHKRMDSHEIRQRKRRFPESTLGNIGRCEEKD